MSWPKACLGDLAQVVSGATPKSSVDHYWDGDIPWITPADLSKLEGKEVSATSRRITEAGLASCSARLLPPKSVLFSSRAPIGHVAINTVPMATNQGFKSFVPDQEILSSDFLYWWLKSNKSYLQSLGRGATFKEVSKEIVESIEIPLPPMEEQRRIAAILDAIDRLKRLRQRSKRTIDLLKQASFRSAIINRNNHLSCESSIPLGDCLVFITSGGRGWSQYYADSGFRFIRSGDVRMNSIARSDPQYVQPPDNAEAKRTRVLAGDVLLTITGSRIGRVAPAYSEDCGAFISQHVAIVRVDNKKLLPSFLSFYLSMPCGGQGQIKKSQYGQTKPGLNFEQIQRFTIPNLPLDEQIRLMSDIAHIDRMLEAQSTHAAKLDEALAAVNALAFSASI